MKKPTQGSILDYASYLRVSAGTRLAPMVWSWNRIAAALQSGVRTERAIFALACDEESGQVAPGLSAVFQVLHAGCRTRPHRHSFWHLYIVWGGTGHAELGAANRRIELNEGDIVFVPPWTLHSFGAGGDAALTLMAMQNAPEMSRKGNLLRSDQTSRIELVTEDASEEL